MPADIRLNWTIPALPLGPAIKPREEVKLCKFREFETMNGSLGTMLHGWMPPASGGASVGQTDDGALTSGPGMRARNAEGSPASSPPSSGVWVPRVGDRVRVRPGYIKGDPYGPGTVHSVYSFVNVRHDYGPPRDEREPLPGWLAENLEPLSPTAERMGEWIEHDGERFDADAHTRGWATPILVRQANGVERETTAGEVILGAWAWAEYGSWQQDNRRVVAYRVVG